MPPKKRKASEKQPVRFDADAAFAPASLKDGQFEFVKVTYRLNPEAQAFKEQLADLVISFVEQLGLSLQALYVELGRRLAERQSAAPALPAPKVASAALPDATRLTKREAQIVALMAQRYSNEDVAERLCISINTLKTHLRHIHQKLGNRGQILAWWEQHRGDDFS